MSSGLQCKVVSNFSLFQTKSLQLKIHPRFLTCKTVQNYRETLLLRKSRNDVSYRKMKDSKLRLLVHNNDGGSTLNANSVWNSRSSRVVGMLIISRRRKSARGFVKLVSPDQVRLAIAGKYGVRVPGQEGPLLGLSTCLCPALKAGETAKGVLTRQTA